MKGPVAFVAVAALGLLLAGCSLGASPGGSPDPTSPAPRGADDGAAENLQVGDCMNDADLSGTITSVPVVPCDGLHDSEAFAEFDLDEGPYPGTDAISAAGDAGCVEAFTAFVGIPYNESELDYSFYYPAESGWPQGDRRILCEVFDPTSQTTGTLEGAAR